MSITSAPFTIKDYKKDCLRIQIVGQLTGNETSALRKEVTKAISSDYDVIYIDAKEVSEADLSGINEVIHSHYTIDKAGKKLVFLFKKDSAIEKWVETTGLDKFVDIAIVAAT